MAAPAGRVSMLVYIKARRSYGCIEPIFFLYTSMDTRPSGAAMLALRGQGRLRRPLGWASPVLMGGFTPHQFQGIR